MSRHVRATVPHKRTRAYVIPDPVAIEQAIAGRRPRLYPSEIGHVVKALTDRGWTGLAIAEHIGTCERTVQRHQARLRAEVSK